MILAVSRYHLHFLLKKKKTKIQNNSKKEGNRKDSAYFRLYLSKCYDRFSSSPLREKNCARETRVVEYNALALLNERSLNRHHRDISFVRWNIVSMSIDEIVSPSVLISSLLHENELDLIGAHYFRSSSDPSITDPLIVSTYSVLDQSLESIFVVCTPSFVSSNEITSCEKMRFPRIDFLTIYSCNLDNGF